MATVVGGPDARRTVAAGVRLRDHVGEKSGNVGRTLKHYALQAREDYVRPSRPSASGCREVL